jgi:hypothetical protein
MKFLTIWKVCGKNYVWVNWHGRREKIKLNRHAEEFTVLLSEPIEHQHYRKKNRVDRLLSKGNRYRGDVLTA